VVVTSELPGVTPGDVTINLQDDVLTLEGARRPREKQNANWQRQERTYGSFSVPSNCRSGSMQIKVEARFNSGILEIELQRLEADRPKKIEIRAG
jgi:HSP20 family protein